MNIPRSLAVALLVVACSPVAAPPAHAPLEGARIGGAFALVDQDGRTVTDRSFAGKYRLMYFGYTFCPDVCPVDMQNVGAGMRLLEKSDPGLAARVVPVFVTVDPARDTPAVLKQFVRAFHPRMIGLTGSQTAIDAAEKVYAIYARKGAISPGGGYMMDHNNPVYLMDPAGKPVALIPADQNPQAVADEIAKWAR
ncbi:SCO family protein [Sphingomonas sp.]|uniref:SCO family protein n=1 Tax=Sphingomonas sp. TaxID=28214 RepID=UPI0035BC7747